MRREDIHIGGVYIARVSKKFVTVRVDEVRNDTTRYSGARNACDYHVTNLVTGKKLKFRSALRFRGVAREGAIPFAATGERVVPHTADERKVSVEEILPATTAVALDPHYATAAELGCSLKVAKMVNYAVAYGVRPTTGE